VPLRVLAQQRTHGGGGNGAEIGAARVVQLNEHAAAAQVCLQRLVHRHHKLCAISALWHRRLYVCAYIYIFVCVYVCVFGCTLCACVCACVSVCMCWREKGKSNRTWVVWLYAAAAPTPIAVAQVSCV
jgi:hypothetical protein